ncbi:MAG: VWA domain-containing protein, partial [Micavibrio sp.]
AAALAAAASASEDEGAIADKIRNFIEANYPPGRVGYTTDIEVVNTHDTLFAMASARLDTSFMRVFGIDTVDISVETEVTKEVKAIEVVLVMDVTGSMTTRSGGKTRLQSLKDAAELFVETMFMRVNDTDMIKIGLVPFSAAVNVGSYGLGYTPDGSYYGSPFIRNPHNIAYYNYTGGNPSSAIKRRWWGCTIEGATPRDRQDHAGPWDLYRYCRRTSDDSVRCDTGNANNDANIGCPASVVTPMTNDKNALLDGIDGLNAAGNTYINIGLVWGYRMISPDFPFQEAEEWDNEDWKKAIVLMTDGVNQPHPYYSAHGLSSGSGISTNTLNTRMLQICSELKEKNVLVYTITFDSGVNAATKTLFRQCATQPGMWYDAPSDEKLQEVYLTIAKELANLHLSK